MSGVHPRSPGTGRCRAGTPTSRTARPHRWSCSSTSASWSPSPPRPRRCTTTSRTTTSRARRIRHGVLRDLVGVGELLVVRECLRHRRHHLPAADLRGDDGVLVVAAGAPRAAGAEHDFWIARRRLRDHAAGDGPALAPRGARAPRGPSYGAALRRRRRLHPGPLGAPDALPRPTAPSAGSRSSPSPRWRWPRRTGPSTAGRHAVAPAPHRRALRAVHDHRARRGDPGDHAGDLGRPGRRTASTPSCCC